MRYTSIKQRSVAKKDAFLPDPMAWMDCSRALLKDFIELCKSAKKKNN